MRRTLCGFVLFGCSLGALPAQGFAEGLAEAEFEIEDRAWGRALEALLALRSGATTDTEREQLAARLSDVGGELRRGAAFAEALRAHTEALAIRRRLHGERDHPDVVQSMGSVAFCLYSLGRVDEALPRFEDALAMRRRLFGDRDHRDVANNLANVAGCLRLLGRAEEALPRLEQALAIWTRLVGATDHPDVAHCVNNVAACLQDLGRLVEALARFESALAMWKRLLGDRDDRDVWLGLNNVAQCLQACGRASDALVRCQEALAMQTRLHGDRDHPDLAVSSSNLAVCLESLGRQGEALLLHQQVLAMRKRLYGDGDHPEVATGLNNVANCLAALGRAGEALPLLEQALARTRQSCGEGDHANVAIGLNNLGHCLQSLGRSTEALTQYEAALVMRRRLFGNRDHPDVASNLANVANCLRSLGRAGDALPASEQALAMLQRLYRDHDHPDLASAQASVAACLQSLGRAVDALPRREQALAIWQRLVGDRDHPQTAACVGNLAHCLEALGRAGDALPRYEAALAMHERLYGTGDHPDVARSLNNTASCLRLLDRANEALPRFERARSIWQRLFGDHDHPDLAVALITSASCLGSLGRTNEALPRLEQALAMLRRLYGDWHPRVATGLLYLALCLRDLGRFADALRFCDEACDTIEHLRDQSRTSSELRQSLFEELKREGAFELQQIVAVQLGRVADALVAAERSRGRELLDLLEQQRFDPMVEAELRARRRGDEAGLLRVQRVRDDLGNADLAQDRVWHLLTRLDEMVDLTDRDRRRLELLRESDEVATRRRQLLDERARVLGDVLPVGRVRGAAEIQALLRPGEVFLEFTVTDAVALVYLLARDAPVEVVPLPNAPAAVMRLLPTVVRHCSHAQLRGRDPAGVAGAADDAMPVRRELFAALVPPAVWTRVQAAKRMFVAAHRDLHRLPFELLVVDVKDGVPVHWLDAGPPISYVPSGSALHWVRQRAGEARDDTTAFDVLAVADPGELAIEPEVPAEGALVMAVNDGSEGARVGLLPRDVILSYDGKALVDDTTLRDLRAATDAAIEDGKRDDGPIPIEVWRAGKTLQLEVHKGLLGVQVGRGKARAASEAALDGDLQRALATRAGDLERLRALPRLQGARAETEAIARVFASKGRQAKRLLGADATEPAVFDLAAKAKYLHFACHGIAEEYASQSLSLLVLSQPQRVIAQDDGLLKLGDLLNHWRGRLSSCRLVVLSACRTNVGPTLRDEAPQALPLGFLFAGAPAVISSLWAVDDASTKELMTDFYGRLLGGETDQLAAFAAAKKALRAKHPDPFHWAPFLYMGSPE